MTSRVLYDITPANGWLFCVHSFTPDAVHSAYAGKKANRRKNRIVAETAYSGSRAVEKAVRTLTDNIPDDQQFVEACLFPHRIVVGSYKEITGLNKRYIREIVDEAASEDKALILGFSVWQQRSVLDTLDLIQYVRKITEDHVVIPVGGPGLSFRDPALEATLFEAGADIINIAGADEFTRWIAKLTSKDRFERDQNGQLHVSIPHGAPFFTAISNRDTTNSGGKIYIPVALDLESHALSVSLPGVGCASSCGFCAIGPHVRCHDSSQFERLADTIKESRGFLDKFSPERHPSYVIDRLRFDTPNLMQRSDLLQTYLEGIDLSRVDSIGGFFGEAPSFLNPRNVQKHLDLLGFIQKERPNMPVCMTLSLDAVQYPNDNDFLNKSIGTQVIQQNEFDTILKNFFVFLKEVQNQEWKDCIHFGVNFIDHPAMTPDVYLRKKVLSAAFRPLIGKDGRVATGVLKPYNGSSISTKWLGHYAPLNYLEKIWEGCYETESGTMSSWGNQFLNGDLLDCVTVAKCLYSKYQIPALGDLAIGLLMSWDDASTQQDYDSVYCSHQDVEASREIFLCNEIDPDTIFKANGPRIIPLLKGLIGPMPEMEGETRKWEFARPGRDLYAMCKWIYHREKYLIEHNPVYAANPHCHTLVKEMKEIMGWFKPYMPAFSAIDERPRLAPSARFSSILPHKKGVSPRYYL